MNEVVRAAAALQAACEAGGIIIRQAGQLDWEYVVAQLAALAELKESPDILRRLADRRNQLDG